MGRGTLHCEEFGSTNAVTASGAATLSGAAAVSDTAPTASNTPVRQTSGHLLRSYGHE